MPYKDKKIRSENQKKWHLKNRDLILEKQKEYRLKIKLEVFSHYCNGEIKCQCCSEKIIEFLSIDHVDGGGTKHRKQIGRGNLYRWLINNNFPNNYRVLCHNCNQAIGIYGKCPHNILK